jgi:hypothetical protein
LSYRKAGMLDNNIIHRTIHNTLTCILTRNHTIECLRVNFIVVVAVVIIIIIVVVVVAAVIFVVVVVCLFVFLFLCVCP